MAFRSNGPTMLALPPFRGVTRQFILIAGSVWLALFVIRLIYGPLAVGLMLNLILMPHWALFGRPWQFITYAFLAGDALSTIFALFSIWISGAMLEDLRSGRWLAEYMTVAAIGGGLLASLLSLAHIPGIGSYTSVFGMWPLALVLLLAIARILPNTEFRIFFLPIGIKAKYLVAIFMAIDLTSCLLGHDYFTALTIVCVALCGFAYLRLAPQRGLGFATSEGWFGIRNAYYRAKRRRAAKKFTVYMRKQGKDVNIDPSGRYVDPDGNPREPKNLNDKRWMN